MKKYLNFTLDFACFFLLLFQLTYMMHWRMQIINYQYLIHLLDKEKKKHAYCNLGLVILVTYQHLICRTLDMTKTLLLAAKLVLDTLIASAKEIVMLFDSDDAHTFPLPAVTVSASKGEKVIDYINNTGKFDFLAFYCRAIQLLLPLMCHCTKSFAPTPLQWAWITNPVANITLK